MRGPDNKGVRKSRRLRRDSTTAEMRLWFALRDRRLGGFKFTRQEVIGPYVVDFICRERKLIVEADGGQHAENLQDQARDAFLRSEQYRVLRFWNHDILSNVDGVREVILAKLQTNES